MFDRSSQAHKSSRQRQFDADIAHDGESQTRHDLGPAR